MRSSMTLKPYRAGMGPTLRVTIGADKITMVATSTKGEKSTVFSADSADWRPAAGQTFEEQVHALLGFAVAYAERGDEFDRSQDESEQIHADWWERHGEAMESEAAYKAGLEE